MPKYYELSRASVAPFQRIIKLSEQNITRNKWSERFSKNKLLAGYEHVRNESNQDSVTNQCTSDEQVFNENMANTESACDTPKTATYEKYKELLESNSTSFSYILEESLKDKCILLNLGSSISNTHVEKFSQYIFESNLDLKFIDLFIQTFLTTYFKRPKTWLSIHILATVFKKYLIQFEPLLLTLLQDPEINTNILQEFITTLSVGEQTEFLKILVHLDISVVDLIRNIFTIYSLYKNSSIDQKIESFISTFLIDASDKCINDKQYGRLLLLFLQNKKDEDKLEVLQKLVDAHRSPFKRPCSKALKDIIEKYS